MAAVALVGTLDTKGPDFAFLAGRRHVHPGRRGAGADHAARLRPAPGRRDRRLGAGY
jgi:hypothetical protein